VVPGIGADGRGAQADSAHDVWMARGLPGDIRRALDAPGQLADDGGELGSGLLDLPFGVT
jgi:hypothetical protein